MARNVAFYLQEEEEPETTMLYDLAYQLRVVARQRGFTLTYLSRVSGYSNRMVSCTLKDNRLLWKSGFCRFFTLCRALDVDMSDVIYRMEKQNQKILWGENRKSSRYQRLIKNHNKKFLAHFPVARNEYEYADNDYLHHQKKGENRGKPNPVYGTEYESGGKRTTDTGEQ